jgi:Transposase
MKLNVLGIDLGKTVFHAVGLDSAGRVVIRKKCSRRQLLAFTANLQVQLIGMESCSGSHFLGRALREQGHEVRLMPAQYVKPYVQTNKSDFLDAEAIAEAVQRPRMRFVPIKTEEQLDLQALHRVRERWVMRRTVVVNQIRNLLLERGADAAERPTPCGCFAPWHPGRCGAEVVRLVSCSIGTAEGGTGSTQRAYRSDGYGDPAEGQRRRGLPTGHDHSGSRPRDRDRPDRRDRQRNCFSERAGLGRLDRNGSPRALHGRQAKVARHQ